MKVVLVPAVRKQLRKLSRVMYREHYFSYPETANAYVNTLIDEIERSLPLYPSHEVSPYFNRYGKDLRYVLIRRSKHTQRYAFSIPTVSGRSGFTSFVLLATIT